MPHSGRPGSYERISGVELYESPRAYVQPERGKGLWGGGVGRGWRRGVES